MSLCLHISTLARPYSFSVKGRLRWAQNIRRPSSHFSDATSWYLIFLRNSLILRDVPIRLIVSFSLSCISIYIYVQISRITLDTYQSKHLPFKGLFGTPTITAVLIKDNTRAYAIDRSYVEIIMDRDL